MEQENYDLYKIIIFLLSIWSW